MWTTPLQTRYRRPMDGPPAELNIVLHQGNNVVATCQNLVLAVWGEASTARPMRAIHQSHLELLQLYPRVGHLAVINDTPKMPTAEAREVASTYNRQSRMTSIAVVVDGEGFWVSAARGFLTAVLFAQRGQSKAKTDVFRNVSDALQWHKRWLDVDAPDADVVRVSINFLRDMVEEPRLR